MLYILRNTMFVRFQNS